MGLVNHHNCWGALLTLAKVHLLIFTMLRNNFKFKYFFGAQVLVENLVLPIFNSCNVLESNNTSEQNKVPHDPKLHSTSPQIFDIDLNAMLQTVVIHVVDESGLAAKKPKKVVIDVNYKF